MNAASLTNELRRIVGAAGVVSAPDALGTYDLAASILDGITLMRQIMQVFDMDVWLNTRRYVV